MERNKDLNMHSFMWTLNTSMCNTEMSAPFALPCHHSNLITGSCGGRGRGEDGGNGGGSGRGSHLQSSRDDKMAVWSVQLAVAIVVAMAMTDSFSPLP